MICKTCITVKGNEIDRMNIVHHSNYPKWFEVGRKDYLRKVGLYKSTIDIRGLYLPLAKMECAFKSPARFGDQIAVITRITSISCVRLKFEYKVFNNLDGKLLTTGNTIHVWTNRSIEPVNIQKEAPEIYELLKQSAESIKDGVS